MVSVLRTQSFQFSVFCSYKLTGYTVAKNTLKQENIYSPYFGRLVGQLFAHLGEFSCLLFGHTEPRLEQKEEVGSEKSPVRVSLSNLSLHDGVRKIERQGQLWPSWWTSWDCSVREEGSATGSFPDFWSSLVDNSRWGQPSSGIFCQFTENFER